MAGEAMTTTKDKLEFALVMGRHTRATLRQAQALMRYAGTLQRLAEDDCNVATDDAGQQRRNRKRGKIGKRVAELCGEIQGIPDPNDPDTPKTYNEVCIPVFSGDPRGAVLKIRVPDGFTNDMGREGICVPS
jgi:hypothetical protein